MVFGVEMGDEQPMLPVRIEIPVSGSTYGCSSGLMVGIVLAKINKFLDFQYQI